MWSRALSWSFLIGSAFVRAQQAFLQTPISAFCHRSYDTQTNLFHPLKAPMLTTIVSSTQLKTFLYSPSPNLRRSDTLHFLNTVWEPRKYRCAMKLPSGLLELLMSKLAQAFLFYFSSSLTGYIDAEARHLFFYFFESRNNPDKDDIIFWTNGGVFYSLFPMVCILILSQDPVALLHSASSWS